MPTSPPKRLSPNILIWELNLFVWERAMDSMIMMLAVQFVGVEEGDDDGWEGDVQSYLSPEVYASNINL